MTPEAQRIAISEACGWMLIIASPGFAVDDPSRYPVGLSSPVQSIHRTLPDYLNDLDAMHEAEATIKPIDVPHYSRELIEVTGASVALANGETWLNTYAMYHATAAQRAEAFLRTIGKWENTPCTPTS